MSDYKNLSPDSKKLLKKLVEDYNSTLEPARRLFNAKDGSSYLYNLFVSNKYKFSARQYNEIYHYIQEKRIEEKLADLIKNSDIF